MLWAGGRGGSSPACLEGLPRLPGLLSDEPGSGCPPAPGPLAVPGSGRLPAPEPLAVPGSPTPEAPPSQPSRECWREVEGGFFEGEPTPGKFSFSAMKQLIKFSSHESPHPPGSPNQGGSSGASCLGRYSRGPRGYTHAPSTLQGSKCLPRSDPGTGGVFGLKSFPSLGHVRYLNLWGRSKFASLLHPLSVFREKSKSLSIIVAEVINVGHFLTLC